MRGPITNKFKNKNWLKSIERFKLDPTLEWKFAEIISLDDNKIQFKIINKKNKNDLIGSLFFKNLKWSVPKKKDPYNRDIQVLL